MRLSISKITGIVITVLLVLQAVLFISEQKLVAAQFGDRFVRLGSSQVSAVTSYEIGVTLNTTNIIGSMKFEFCSNDPLVDTACTIPSGFDLNSSSILNQSGEIGWTIHANSNANTLILTRTPVLNSTGLTELELGDVTNPDSTGTHFVRVTTHANTDGSSSNIDEGGLAFAVNEQLGLSTYVPPYITFCAGKSIASNSGCTGVSNGLGDFGTFSTNQTRAVTTQFAVATNATYGYSVSVIGTSLTSGSNVIDRMATPTAPVVGLSQFGVNLRNNSSPNIGANISGVGQGVVAPDYRQVNRFKFNNGDVVATSPGSTGFQKYTVSHVTNIDDSQNPGIYSTTLTYVCLATF